MRPLLLLALVALPSLAQSVPSDPPQPPPPPPPSSPVNSPAMSQAPILLFDAERPSKLLDLGATGGFNNPGGIIGAEADFRLFTGSLSAGLSGGTGVGGVRVSPHVRAYPFGVDVAGLFAEAAVSMNFGGTTETKINGQMLERAERLVTPVIHVGAGWRQTLNSFTYLLFRVGWGFRFTDDNYRYTIGNGDAGLGALLALSEPGGFSIGLSAGFSIF